MRGAPGTSIKLTIVRPGREQSFDVGITREIIELKPVRWEVKHGIGVINIVSFSADTGAGVQESIRGIEKYLGRKPLGYIVDLSSNPGGLLDEAVNVSGILLEHGAIVSPRSRTKGDIARDYAKAGSDTE